MKHQKKLEEIEALFEELNRQMADPRLISDPEAYRKTAKKHRDLEEIVSRFRDWKKVNADLEGARQMLSDSDAELRQMAQADVDSLGPERDNIEEGLRALLQPWAG